MENVSPATLKEHEKEHNLLQNIFFEQIANSATLEELEENLSDEEIQAILNDLGASTVPSGIDKKDWYKKIILHHVLIDSTRYLLEELKSGLQTLGVLDAMKEHPYQFRDAFTKENFSPISAMRRPTFYNPVRRTGIQRKTKAGAGHSLLEGLPSRL